MLFPLVTIWVLIPIQQNSYKFKANIGRFKHANFANICKFKTFLKSSNNTQCSSPLHYTGFAKGELELLLANKLSNVNYYTLIIYATFIRTTSYCIKVSAAWALTPYEISIILVSWSFLQKDPAIMVCFLPKPYIIEAICNPVELCHMGSTSKVPLFLLCHCFISVLDKC